MRKGKRGGGDLASSSHKITRARSTEWVSGRLRDEDSNQDVCTELSDCVKSDFRKSVASISLCNGDVPLFSCSGIAIARHGHCLTRFLTSASLVRAFNGKTNEQYYDLKIVVRHEGKKVYMGFLAEYDLVRNFAVVNVRAFIDVHVGIFQRVLESVPYGEAYVVGRDVSGDLMVRSVELGGDLRVSKDDKDLDSKRKTSKVWEGGSIFSFDGKFVGMNFFLVPGRVIFLPWSTISKRLEFHWISYEKVTGLAPLESLRVYGFGAPEGGKPNSYQEAHTDLLNQEQLHLDSRGYPQAPPTMSGANMILVNTFEKTFGDKHGEGVWTKLSGEAASSIGHNVVALASFNGERRFFACTGFFIGWNESTVILTSASLIRNSGDGDKIVENLRIKVKLQDNTCVDGTLEHHDFHYNVALVSVKDCDDLCQANTLHSASGCRKVAAVGRCFDSGALMAMSGELVSWTGTLDCIFLVRSSCKITKAGIGGPLVTLDGNVLGMNFYDKKIGTPFLLWYNICEILESFKSRRKAGDPSGAPFWKIDRDGATRLNRWPVPMPCWRLSDVDGDNSDEDVGVDSEYGYVKGEKVLLL